jgi:glycosyltransferase involved in cell wall biosynthesis
MELPKISVIVPVLNEEKYIKELLESINQQNYPKKQIELIIIDGNSTDNTLYEIQKNKDKYEFKTKILINKEKITPISLNMGIKNAKNKYIIRLDAHAKYNKNYFKSAIIELERDPNLVSVGGYLHVTPSENTTKAKAISYVWKSVFGSGFSHYRVNHMIKIVKEKVDTVPFGVYRTKQIKEAGYFDEKLKRGQDIDLYYRLKKKYKGDILITPDMKIYYKFKPSNTVQLFKRQFTQGEWVFKRSHGILLRHYLPLILFWLAIIIFIILPEALYTLTALYVIIASFFYLKETETTKEKLFLPYGIWAYIVNHSAFIIGLNKSFIDYIKEKLKSKKKMKDSSMKR